MRKPYEALESVVSEINVENCVIGFSEGEMNASYEERDFICNFTQNAAEFSGDFGRLSLSDDEAVMSVNVRVVVNRLEIGDNPYRTIDDIIFCIWEDVQRISVNRVIPTINYVWIDSISGYTISDVSESNKQISADISLNIRYYPESGDGNT